MPVGSLGIARKGAHALYSTCLRTHLAMSLCPFGTILHGTRHTRLRKMHIEGIEEFLVRMGKPERTQYHIGRQVIVYRKTRTVGYREITVYTKTLLYKTTDNTAPLGCRDRRDILLRCNVIQESLGTEIVALHQGLINDIGNRAAIHKDALRIGRYRTIDHIIHNNPTQSQFLNQYGYKEIGRLVHIHPRTVTLGTVTVDAYDIAVHKPVAQHGKLSL